MNLLYINTFFLPLIMVFVVAIVLLAFLFFRSVYKKERDFENKREKVFDDYQDILTKANTKAENVIEDAMHFSDQIRDEEKKLETKLTSDAQATLAQILSEHIRLLKDHSGEFRNSYIATLSEFQKSYEKEMQSLLTDLHTQTKTEFDGLRSMLQKETLDTKQAISTQLKEEIEKAKVEVNEYKTHAIEQVEKDIETLVTNIAQQVLGKSISVADHQQLIIQALDAAKKEGIISL